MCNTGNVFEVSRLLKLGASVNVTDNAGWSLLHEAALEGHAEVVKVLLEVEFTHSQ